MLKPEPNVNWKMRAIDSSSGNSYMGEVGNQRVFIKLNASPLLPSLSTEGITPKIQWISKTDNGGTLTAQSWIEGHTLSADEMNDPQVYEILKKLHSSRTLRDSLFTFDHRVASPSKLMENLLNKEQSFIANNTYLSKIAESMMTTMPVLNNLGTVVVHGDI